MKKIFALIMSLALAVGPVPTHAGICGIFRPRSRCTTKVAVVNKVQTVVAVQSVPVQVTFVPSQVLLNSQVTQYTSTPFSYSYQGSAIDPKAYGQQQQAQPQAQAQAQPQAQGNTLEDRVSRMETLLDKMAEKMGISVQTTSDPSMAFSVKDQQHLTTAWQSCKTCHSPGKKGYEKLAMFDAGGALLDKLPRYKIYNAVQSGHMPPAPSEKIKGEQLESLRKWVHQGLSDLKY